MIPRLLLYALLISIAAPVFAQERASWMELDEALQAARQTHRPVLVYVSASWCAVCYRVEEEVFPEVSLDGFVPAKVRFDEGVEPAYRGFANTPHGWLRTLGIDAPPAFLLLEPDGSLVTAAAGFLKSGELAVLLQFVASGSHRSMNLKDFIASTDASP